MIRDISRALGQIGDPRFRKVLLLGLGITIGLLLAFYVVTAWLVAWIVPDTVTLPWIGQVGWINDIASGASVLGAMVLSSFLMVPVASAFTGMFLDQVADAVEDRHYPHLPDVRPTPFTETLADTFSFLGVMILANIAAFALYIFLAPFAPLIFWGLNGFLLGREYFQLVAMRRLGAKGAKELRRKHFASIWILGALMAIPLTVPLVNLLVPIIGAAAFTHFYHRLARS
ncbi:EI24 domain-containing protein [Mangrovicoccus algicola]|uniref:EI24 domain-containing protein n=1 Tax=Mangrovicoccus algicola TaxID=2771008 RepID=A0A8J6Z8P9_9RHOB|nr:EI24 domain-containing protein [Mangrovicoccus algicola]MBE3637901.1 EI24 domain-containing protein [Mangrovicoccus algicola]